MKHEKITRAIIGATMKVHSRLKPGLDESFYEKALVIELAGSGLAIENQREFSVYYEGHFLGKLVPDLIVENAVIADPKVVNAFNDAHIAQMLGYLNVTGLEVALLLNFKHASLQWRRVVVGGDPTLDCGSDN
jgi:GxxExxY protein